MNEFEIRLLIPLAFRQWVVHDESGKWNIKEYDVIPIVCHIAEGEAYTVYYLENYTKELAAKSKIVSQAPDFSKKTLETVWEWR